MPEPFIRTLLGIGVIYITFIGIKNVFRYNKLKLMYQSGLDAYYKQLNSNKYYKQQLLDMQSADYWTFQLTSRLGYVREGDHVFKFRK